MRLAKDQTYLVRQVRILLDGDDVTRNCDAFDVEGGFVRLYERNARGGIRLENVCPSCAETTPEPPRRRWGACPSCGTAMELQPARRLHRGRVEVVPLRGPVLRFFWRWRHAVAVQWRTFWDVRELRQIAARLRARAVR
jgi:hypothetical protein